MNRIDLYLIILYLRTFLVCFVTISGLWIIAQLLANLDELIAFGRIRGNLPLALAEYFGPTLLIIFDRTCGLTSLLSFLFVISFLHKTNEWTAMLAAGISKARVTRSLFVLASLVILASAVTREVFIPKFSNILSKNPQDLQGAERVVPIKPTEDAEYGLLIGGKSISVQSKTIRNPIFVLFSPASAIVSQIQAQQAVYQEANADHVAGYLLSGMDEKKFLESPSVVIEGVDYLRLPSDTPWLATDQCFLPSVVEFEMLRGSSAKQFSSTSDLIWRARNQGDYYGDDLQLYIHQRFLQPLTDFSQLLLGLPFVLTSKRKNIVQLFLTVCLTWGLVFGVSTGLPMFIGTINLITPTVASWLPVILFGPYGYARTMQALMD